MSTVVSIMDRSQWDANTDNIVVADPDRRALTWVPRDLWCERFRDRINTAFARRGHPGLINALMDLGIAADHSLCLRREALERALDRLSVTVPISERLEFWYPLHPTQPIEDGRTVVTFEPPEERLAGERIHQWLGARYERDDRGKPLLFKADFGRMRRQQVLVRSLLESGFDFASVLEDPELVSASGAEAVTELSQVEPGWRFSLVEDVSSTVHDGMMVLVRTVAPPVGSDL
jgi:anionic cell wall polymer biosynthesis LytR-Cps2A-Psr (LCP) family protein